MDNKIGLFYGSTTCYTEMAAEKIRDAIVSTTEGAIEVDLFDITDQSLALIEPFQQLILGIPTWDYGELQEDWENIWPQLAGINWQGKTVALYGLGDQIGYPEWFQDAMGYLWEYLVGLGAKCIGAWPNAAYTYTALKAISEDGLHFVGLALDEDNEFDLSEARIKRWCQQILQEFESAECS